MGVNLPLNPKKVFLCLPDPIESSTKTRNASMKFLLVTCFLLVVAAIAADADIAPRTPVEKLRRRLMKRIGGRKYDVNGERVKSTQKARDKEPIGYSAYKSEGDAAA